MNLKSSPTHDRLRPPTAIADNGTTANAIKEFILLEECVARCESLAESIATERQHEDLIRDLSECIAACQSYLAAKARESRFEAHLLSYCVEALTATADACAPRQDTEARNCRKIATAALRQLQSRHPSTSATMN